MGAIVVFFITLPLFNFAVYIEMWCKPGLHCHRSHISHIISALQNLILAESANVPECATICCEQSEHNASAKQKCKKQQLIVVALVLD
jgi:hypothetical protein